MRSPEGPERATNWPWRGLQLVLLRTFLRVVPSEQQRVFVLTIAVGAVCGLAAVLFHQGIGLVTNAVLLPAVQAPGWWWVAAMIAVPTIGALVCGLLLHFVVPAAAGSGVPQVKVAFAVGQGRLRLRDTVGKFGIGILQIGTGSSLGREGPTVQICAGIASALGRLAALSPKSIRRLIPVGAAAGIAAAFNAPIAAVTFTIEEVIEGLDQTVLSGVVIAAAVASIIERSILGEHPVLPMGREYGFHHASSLAVYAGLGVAAALVAIVFVDLLLETRARFARSRVPAWARPAIGGFITGALAAGALAATGRTGISGGGYETLTSALSGGLPLISLLVLCGAKVIATVSSYSSGGAGGLFAPVLFMGAMLGGAVGLLDPLLFGHSIDDIGAFALVGMGALFAAVVRAPVTSVLIIFEMTGSYGLILPLMIANMTAYGIARKARPLPIYEALLKQDGVHLPHGSTNSMAFALEQLRVSEATTIEVTVFHPDAQVSEAAEQTADKPHVAYPVVDSAKQVQGVVYEADLRRAVAEGRDQSKVTELLSPCDRIGADDSLANAVVRMNACRGHELMVVYPHDSNHFVGLLTMADVLRVEARAVAGSEAFGHASSSGAAETLAQASASVTARSKGR